MLDPTTLATGVVAAAPGGEFPVGQQVATLMGGMGRTLDGGYAEYMCVPATQVVPFHSGLDWATLGAVPDRAAALETPGVDHVVVDTGEVAVSVRSIVSAGVERALELVGIPTLPDTLRATAIHGVVCFTGMLSNQWIVRVFYPIDCLPARRAAHGVQRRRQGSASRRLAIRP